MSSTECVISKEAEKYLGTLSDTLYVELSHCPNPDIAGYWEYPEDDGDPRWMPVETVAEASELCCEFIQRNGLGGGNWSGGVIKDRGKEVAYVGYNGTVWKEHPRDWGKGESTKLWSPKARTMRSV